MTYTIYKSSDADAPQMTNTAGALKTILKACLITGYGSGADKKQGADWEMLFEQPHDIVIRSKDPHGENQLLKIYRDNTRAGLSVYTSMTDINDESAQIINKQQFYEKTADWTMIASQENFMLFFTLKNRDSYGLVFFGNIASAIPEEENKTVLINNYQGSNIGSHTSFVSRGFCNADKIFFGASFKIDGNSNKNLNGSAENLKWCDISLSTQKDIVGVLPILKAVNNDMQFPSWYEVTPNVYAIRLASWGVTAQFIIDLTE